MNKLNVHLGTLRSMGDRFINAWNRAETGDDVKERHVTFFTWEVDSGAHAQASGTAAPSAPGRCGKYQRPRQDTGARL